MSKATESYADEEYDTRDIKDNEITTWSGLKHHLRKLSEQMEELEEIPENENPIPEKYDPESDAMAQVDRILRDYDDELEGERGNRRDLTESLGIANDPDHAKDHDDAYNVFQHGDGSYTAQVHIADVSHFIEPGSPIDQELLDRGVTFYLGDNTRHMTPESLAQDVFSLAPGKDRLALTIEMDFDRNGNRTETDIYESVVNTEHLTYTHADAIIESEEELQNFYSNRVIEEDDAHEFQEITRNISDAKELAEKLRRKRWPDSLILNSKDSESSKIVEELMVEANSAVGDYLRDERDVGLFRVEPEPEEDLADNIAEVLRDYGYEPSNLNGDLESQTARTINNFFHATEDSKPGVDTVKQDEEHEKEVRSEIVKNLERAKFTSSLSGGELHDGLDIVDYAQSTSPIRRLPDLWNHRLLKDENWTWSELTEVADKTTQQEILADEASRVWYDAST